MKTTYITIGIVTAVLLIAVIPLLISRYNGASVPIPDIPREPLSLDGEGDSIEFVVMGDSTAVGQGGQYDRGIARSGARLIATQTKRPVTMSNTGVSGATTADVLTKQLDAALQRNPDVVLISISANDVTKLTSAASIRSSTTDIITQLRTANPNVIIIHTGTPAMGSIPRLIQPVRILAGWRADSLNTMFKDLARDNDVTLIPLAAETGPIFAANPQLFAADKFHPNDAGYDVWTTVINRSLVAAVEPISL